MRILHISTRLILGGSQENTILSCEGQARLGHDVHLAFGPIYGPEGSLLERAEGFRTPGGRGISTHIIPDLIRAVHPPRDWRSCSQMRRLIGDLQPDIVHTHSSKAGILGRRAAWAEGRSIKPDPPPPGWREHGCKWGVVHTIHGPPFMPVEDSLPRRLKTRAVNALYECAERSAARRCHIIVSVADAMTRQFLARGIGRPEQYVTVYSGMETGPYLNPVSGQTRQAMRARLGLTESDILIGTVARLAEHKGHDDLLDALAPDLKAHPDWKLLWVGDGWWRSRLIGKARSLGLAVHELDKPNVSLPQAPYPDPPHPHPSILLTGLIPPGDVPGHIRAMDILAHPSYREGLPRTIPQALLCGVCPVAYDVDGTGEACRDMETGRLVRLGDRDGLRDAIRRLIDQPAEREAMALRGREWCRDRFSAETMVAQLEKVYARALELASCGARGR